MSALTDLFTALANKIRSKTGTATTYTPLQMVSDGIDDVYAAGYDAGGGGATGIPITPSNASPVSLTTGDSYEMLADGYAISSYTNVTPSNSSPVSLADDTIYKTGGAGVAIESYLNATPSDSSPASLSSGGIYKMGGAGVAVEQVNNITPSSNMPSMTKDKIYKPSNNSYAIASYTPLTPSDSSPVALTGATVYRTTNGSSGYAISSYGNVTPSASAITLAAGSIYKMSGVGYLYNSLRKRTASGTVALSTSASNKVTTGFRPKYIMAYPSSTTSQGFCYNADISTTQFRFFNSSGNGNANLGSSTSNYLYSISDDGFTINKASSARTYYWFASE